MRPLAPLQPAVRHLPSALVLLLLVACSAPPLSPTPSPTARPSSPSVTPTTSPSGEPSASPGRPYDAAAVLDAMRSSRRPGGVPAELQTTEIATAVARRLWTWDGSGWPELVIGGACGPESCSLDVAGSPEGAGTDLYSFHIDPGTGRIITLSTDLHGYPPALDAQLRSVAEAKAARAIGKLSYTSARWLPPPDAGRYWAAYRSGGEEGLPGIDLLIDLAAGRVLRRQPRPGV